MKKKIYLLIGLIVMCTLVYAESYQCEIFDLSSAGSRVEEGFKYRNQNSLRFSMPKNNLGSSNYLGIDVNVLRSKGFGSFKKGRYNVYCKSINDNDKKNVKFYLFGDIDKWGSLFYHGTAWQKRRSITSVINKLEMINGRVGIINNQVSAVKTNVPTAFANKYQPPKYKEKRISTSYITKKEKSLLASYWLNLNDVESKVDGDTFLYKRDGKFYRVRFKS